MATNRKHLRQLELFWYGTWGRKLGREGRCVGRWRRFAVLVLLTSACGGDVSSGVTPAGDDTPVDTVALSSDDIRGDVNGAERLVALAGGETLTGTGIFLTLASTDDQELQHASDVTVVIDPILGTLTLTIDDDTPSTYGPILAVPSEDGEDRFGFVTLEVGPDSKQVFAGVITPLILLDDGGQATGLDEVDSEPMFGVVVAGIWDFYPVIVDDVWRRLSERSTDLQVGDDDAQFWLVNTHYAADIWDIEAYFLSLGVEPVPADIGTWELGVVALDDLDIWGDLLAPSFDSLKSGAPGYLLILGRFLVSGGAEDLDAIAGSPQFFECPIGYQLDIIGRLLSGKDGEQSELIAETPEAEGSNVACTKYNKRNPHVFALIVEGDGESLSTADNTSYQVRYVVNNEWPLNEYYDDTGFEVLVEWNRLAKHWVGVVRDQQGNRLSNDADVTIEWLDSSTLQVVVDVPGLDVEVTEMRTELNVYVTDDNNVRQYDHFDVAIWHKEP